MVISMDQYPSIVATMDHQISFDDIVYFEGYFNRNIKNFSITYDGLESNLESRANRLKEGDYLEFLIKGISPIFCDIGLK